MNPIALLKDEHEQVRRMLTELEASNGDAERLQELARMLAIHSAGEEDVIYPALREQVEDEDQIEEAFEEHQEVDALLDEIREIAAGDPQWSAKITELREALEHHIEEEENELLPKLENAVDGEELDQLAEDMEDVRGEMRDWIAEHPEAGAQEAAEALAKGFEEE